MVEDRAINFAPAHAHLTALRISPAEFPMRAAHAMVSCKALLIAFAGTPGINSGSIFFSGHPPKAGQTIYSYLQSLLIVIFELSFPWPGQKFV
jgi:hypothetical protein